MQNKAASEERSRQGPDRNCCVCLSTSLLSNRLNSPFNILLNNFLLCIINRRGFMRGMCKAWFLSLGPFFLLHYSYLTASLGDRQDLQLWLSSDQPVLSSAVPATVAMSHPNHGDWSTSEFRVCGGQGHHEEAEQRPKKELSWLNISSLEHLVFPMGIIRFTFSSRPAFQRRAPSNRKLFSSSFGVENGAAALSLWTLSRRSTQLAGMDCWGNGLVWILYLCTLMEVGLRHLCRRQGHLRELNLTLLHICTFSVFRGQVILALCFWEWCKIPLKHTFIKTRELI